MELKNIVKSLAIIGLLAGVTDANAAKTVKGSLGQYLHCPDLTIQNDSQSDGADANWTASVVYYDCVSGSLVTPAPTVAPGEKKTFSTRAEHEVRIDRIIPGSRRTPNVWSVDKLESDATLNCTGTSESAKCHAPGINK